MGSYHIPVDIIHAVLEQVNDRRDLHSAALASRDFNRAATPLLYRTLDSDMRTKGHSKEVMSLFTTLNNMSKNMMRII
jgi:hypothetical protein